MAAFWGQFIDQITQTGWVEFIAVIAGIVSVWCSKRESIWVFPIGLINTIFYIYISIKGSLWGEASVNMYYTVMSVYGWMIWSKKNTTQHPELQISGSTKADWQKQLLFFVVMYTALFIALLLLKKNFAPDAIPWADALASASAYTGMWLMTRKKTESWVWWIITNMASIPLFYIKGYAFTSVYYSILLAMAIAGLIEWKKKENRTNEC
jgi:nicotinamide mononucleotide transporter